MLGVFPKFANNILDHIIYSEFGQNLVGAAEYWRNPESIDKYVEKARDLPVLDNLKNYQDHRK